jgi:hypothetical protein
MKRGTLEPKPLFPDEPEEPEELVDGPVSALPTGDVSPSF